MPETLRGLWRQRLRWAEGGVQMMLAFFRPMITGRAPSLLPTYINYVLSLLWSYTMLLSFCVGLLWVFGFAPPSVLPGYQLIPEWWGLDVGDHLHRAGLGKRSAGEPLRAAHAALAVLDDLVPDGLLADRDRDHRRRLSARTAAAAARAHDLGQS
jgi:cellulose synthase/poly-beta-1,6-N-acetylglucosamine synthase-like glycosyltransferase